MYMYIYIYIYYYYLLPDVVDVNKLNIIKEYRQDHSKS